MNRGNDEDVLTEKCDQKEHSYLWVIVITVLLLFAEQSIWQTNTHTKKLTQKTVQVIIDVTRIIQFISAK